MCAHQAHTHMRHTSGIKIKKFEFSSVPHVCNSMMPWGAPMRLNLSSKVSAFQRWVPIVHISRRNEHNWFWKNEQHVQNGTFSHFAHQILWFVSAVCRLRATCVRILWTDSNSIECPEGFRSNFASQGRTILRISQPFLALIWAKISYLISSIFKIPHQLRDFCSN